MLVVQAVPPAQLFLLSRAFTWNQSKNEASPLLRRLVLKNPPATGENERLDRAGNSARTTLSV